MTRKLYLVSIFALITILVAACGTVAEPEVEMDDVAEETHAEEETAEEVAVEPTEVPPTEIPPTEVPPTEIPPTEIPPTDEAPEEASSDDTGDTGSEEERIAALVDAADASVGETLFTNGGCSACHMTDSENPLVGPGLLNLFTRAEDRVEGQGPNEYVFLSIRASQDFIVEGFPAGVMPNFDQYSDEDIYDLMAYLRTLN